jgi:hypothetical protein
VRELVRLVLSLFGDLTLWFPPPGASSVRTPIQIVDASCVPGLNLVLLDVLLDAPGVSIQAQRVAVSWGILLKGAGA